MRLPSGFVPPAGARVIARLEEVTRVDAAAVVVDVVHAALASMPNELTLRAPDVDEGGSYVVRVLVEGPDGALLLASRQSYPVLTSGYPSDLEVEVAPVP